MAATPASSQKLKVCIYSAEALFKQMEVEAISSENSAGEFSVLPNHAQLITLLEDTEIKFYEGGEVSVTVPCNIAVMHVNQNTVDIFMDL